jgi:hypothetical protein
MKLFNHYQYDDKETQQFMPQYSYGAVAATDTHVTPEYKDNVTVTTETEQGLGVGRSSVVDDYYYNNNRNVRSSSNDAHRQRKIVRMVLLTIVSAAAVLFIGRTTGILPSSSLAATADVAPGTTPGSPFANPWKQWGQGLSNYWSKKGTEWSKMKDDLVAKVTSLLFYVFVLLLYSYCCNVFWKHILTFQFFSSFPLASQPVTQNATKDEIKDAHDKFWADSKNDFAYIPDKPDSADGS